MLQNGLGELLAREVRGVTRFVDLFAGSSAVATHVAVKHRVPVVAYDLQLFSVVLAKAVLSRQFRVDSDRIWQSWFWRAADVQKSVRPPSVSNINRAVVASHRAWCASQCWSITKAYGGYYFSAVQATWLDALRQTIPPQEPEKSVTLAALISAASRCAAAPGHTAQPFQPTRSAKPFLVQSWLKDIVTECKADLSAISKIYANVEGQAEVADANDVAQTLSRGDLAFVDPPYSGVHYSRFYHVLESIARGECSAVSGQGRYPPRHERPRSRYSVSTESSDALKALFSAIAERGAAAVVTFPQRLCSNGLSGTAVMKLAKQFFNTERHWVASKFSTLGGNNEHRYARRATRELILVLR